MDLDFNLIELIDFDGKIPNEFRELIINKNKIELIYI